MSLFSSAHNPPRPQAGSPDAMDSFWYQRAGGLMTAIQNNGSGIYVNDTTIKMCAIALNALRWLQNAVAVCSPPSITFEPDETDGSRKRVPRNHYLRKLMRKPNPRQNYFDWTRNMMWEAALSGNAYSEIVLGGPTSKNPIERLEPLSSDVTEPYELRGNGELVYSTQRFVAGPIGRLGPVLRLGQENIWHLKGVTADGIVGLPTRNLIRNAISIAVAAERHTATYLRKGSRLAGMLITAGPMTKEKRDELRESVNATLGGSEQTGTLGILPYGVDIKPTASTNRESQLLELRDFQLAEILRGLGVPGIVCGYSDKTQGYASAKEFMEGNGLRGTLMPWLEAFEAAHEFSLVFDDEPIEFEYDMDIMTRPETWTRIEMLVKAAGRAFMTGDEARVMQGMNPTKEESMTKVVEPKANGGLDAELGGDKGGAPKTKPGRSKPAPAPSDDERSKRAAVVKGAVALLLEIEISGLVAKAPKYAKNPEGWTEWVAGYYDKHAARMANTLSIPLVKAQVYCLQHAAAVTEKGVSTCEAWPSTIPPLLEELALADSEEAA